MGDPELCVCLGCGQPIGEATGPKSTETLATRGQCHCRDMATAAPAEVQLLRCSGCGGSLLPEARACPYCRATVATSRCGGCLTWNLAEARHCNGCGASLAGEADGEAWAAPGSADEPRGCPRCAGQLTLRSYGGHHVGECDACGGLFVPPSVLDRLVASRDASSHVRALLPIRVTVRESSVRYIGCPVCSHSMNRKMFGRVSGVVVDVCRDHGVWFDAGELGQVLMFVERGGLELARARDAQLQREEARAAQKTVDAVRPETHVSLPGEFGYPDAFAGGHTFLEELGEGIVWILEHLGKD